MVSTTSFTTSFRGLNIWSRYCTYYILTSDRFLMGEDGSYGCIGMVCTYL